MPTVLRKAGFEVRIYTFDHPPPHVHVEKAGASVKIDLATTTAVRITGRFQIVTLNVPSALSRSTRKL